MTQSEVRDALLSAGIANADGEARILCEEYDGKALAAAVARRTAHEPLQYILGDWDFYRETYKVTPDCLIPRPDTEVLVETLAARLPQGARFLDLCTGSGCVAVSTANARRDTTALAADISEAALALAKENAKRNGANVTFFRTDVRKAPTVTGPFDCICANPPYIRTAVLKTLSPEVRCEPTLALDGGEDGMDFYRAIVKNYTPLLAPDGFFAFEFGFDQAAAAAALAAAHGFTMDTVRDYGGNFRVALFYKK